MGRKKALVRVTQFMNEPLWAYDDQAELCVVVCINTTEVGVNSNLWQNAVANDVVKHFILVITISIHYFDKVHVCLKFE